MIAEKADGKDLNSSEMKILAEEARNEINNLIKLGGELYEFETRSRRDAQALAYPAAFFLSAILWFGIFFFLLVAAREAEHLAAAIFVAAGLWLFVSVLVLQFLVEATGSRELWIQRAIRPYQYDVCLFLVGCSFLCLLRVPVIPAMYVSALLVLPLLVFHTLRERK